MPQCQAIKSNGKPCRQAGKPCQKGGPVIDGYCSFHADQCKAPTTKKTVAPSLRVSSASEEGYEPSFKVLTNPDLLGLIGEFCPSARDEWCRWREGIRSRSRQDPAIPHIERPSLYIYRFWSGTTIVIRQGIRPKDGKLSRTRDEKIKTVRLAIDYGCMGQSSQAPSIIEQMDDKNSKLYLPRCGQCTFHGHGTMCCPDRFIHFVG
jgi:hypothetical protein